MDRRAWQLLLWTCIGAAVGAAPAPEERPELPAPVSPVVVPFQAGPAEVPTAQTVPAVVSDALGAQRNVAEAPLRWSWENPDHASGIYYAKADAKLTLLLDNTTKDALPVAGQILFGRLEGPAPGTFKPLSVTPLAAATLQGGQRAKIPLAVTFAAAGDYESAILPAAMSPLNTQGWQGEGRGGWGSRCNAFSRRAPRPRMPKLTRRRG